MDFHFGSFEPSVTKNDSVAELGNENIYFCPVQASSACRVVFAPLIDGANMGSGGVGEESYEGTFNKTYVW